MEDTKLVDMTPEAFVDAGLNMPREKLLDAAEELIRHRNYLIAARETVDSWEPGLLINKGYLNVVKDILATAERLAGIPRTE